LDIELALCAFFRDLFGAKLAAGIQRADARKREMKSTGATTQFICASAAMITPQWQHADAMIK